MMRTLGSSTNSCTSSSKSASHTICGSLCFFLVLLACPWTTASATDESPKIRPFAIPSNVKEGTRVALTCVPESGSHPLRFQWSKDGRSLPTATDVRIESSSSLSILVIDHVLGTDSANYTCRVSNEFGQDSFTVTLNVQVAPTLDRRPADVSVGVGQSLELACTAKGYPKPTIIWNRINDDSANGAIRGSPPDSNSNSGPRKRYMGSGFILKFGSITLEDAGRYECVAENPANGLSAAHSFLISVNVPAQFLQKSSLVSVKYGQTARLSCTAFGAKPMQLTWSREDGNGHQSAIPLAGPIGSSSSSSSASIAYHRAQRQSVDAANAPTQRYTSFEKDFEGAENKTVYELHISRVQPTDDGLYVCMVSNGYGQDERRIKLLIQDVPSAPRELSAEQTWSRSVALRWSAPIRDGNSPVVHYIMQYWRDNRSSSTSHRLFEEQTPGPLTSHVLRDRLLPGTWYALRVAAVNEFGRGQPSSPVLKFATAEEEPNGPPMDIQAESRGTTAIRIRWKAPPRSAWNGQLRGFLIGYRLLADDAEATADSSSDTTSLYSFKSVAFTGKPDDNFDQEYILTGLVRAAAYSVVIRAYNGAGNGPLSQKMLTTTSNNDPPLPPSVWIANVKEDSISLKWDQRGNSADITHYVLYYKDDRSPWLEIAFPISSQNEYRLEHLEPGTFYELYMRCMSKRGPSDPSEVLTEKTSGSNARTGHGFSAGGRGTSSVRRNNRVGSAASKSSTTSTAGGSSSYWSSIIVIPISAAAVIIVIVCAIAYAYVKVEERKTAAYRGTTLAGGGVGGGGGPYDPDTSTTKRFQYFQGGGSNGSSPSRGQSVVSEEGSMSLRYSDSSDRGRPLLAGSQRQLQQQQQHHQQQHQQHQQQPHSQAVLWARQQGPILEEGEEPLPPPPPLMSASYPSPYASVPLQRLSTFNGQPPPSSRPPPPPTALMSSSSSSSTDGQQHRRASYQSPPTTPAGNLFCQAIVHNDEDASSSEIYDVLKPQIV